MSKAECATKIYRDEICTVFLDTYKKKGDYVYAKVTEKKGKDFDPYHTLVGINTSDDTTKCLFVIYSITIKRHYSVLRLRLIRTATSAALNNINRVYIYGKFLPPR